MSRSAVAIDTVAKNRSAKIMQVDAELVGAASDRLELDEGEFTVTIEDSIMSLSWLAARIYTESGRALEIAGDGEIDHGFVELWAAFNYGVVGLVGLAVLELFTEHFLSFWVFSKDYYP